jgi:peptide/nickel transport system substrate-binding protein
MAIDRQAVIDKVWDGKGSILNFPYHSNLPETLYTPPEKLPRSTQEQFEYNPERARQLLAEAGYSNGFETTIQLDNREALSDIAVLLVAFWKDIGVDVSIDVQDQTSMGSILRSKKHEPVTLFTHGGPADQFSPLGVYIFPNFVLNTSSSTTKSIVMDNPELQELYDRAFGTLDVVEQQKLLKELSQKILAGNYYAIVPTGHVNLAHWPWLENYYGEDGESVGGLQRGVFSRVWINSALKQELGGE